MHCFMTSNFPPQWGVTELWNHGGTFGLKQSRHWFCDYLSQSLVDPIANNRPGWKKKYGLSGKKVIPAASFRQEWLVNQPPNVLATDLDASEMGAFFFGQGLHHLHSFFVYMIHMYRAKVYAHTTYIFKYWGGDTVKGEGGRGRRYATRDPVEIWCTRVYSDRYNHIYTYTDWYECNG